MLIFKLIISGVIVKAIASFDDFLTRIPLLAELTKTRKGKIAFAFGNLLAILFVIILAIIFADLLNHFVYANYISAGLIFVLAVLIYLNVLQIKPHSKLEKKIIKIERISYERFMKLIGIGFIISFITLIDDSIVLAGLFINKNIVHQGWISLGIVLISIIQLFILIYFSEKISHLKYKKELASLGMIIVGILVLAGLL